MTERYHIEDLVRQDSLGVDYRALDAETGSEVALRRFFPYGIDGGGLAAKEQEDYRAALERFSEINHPSLRQILGGGCDPIDGMPFLVTQWHDGASLDAILPPEEVDVTLAVEWIMQALEVSELLSHLFGEQAIWIETNPNVVFISGEQDGFRASFLISPLKWLGNSGDRSLQTIVDLTQTIMGWHRRVIHDHAGHGLGGWVNWLRSASPTTTLQEARDMLAASVGAEAPPSTSKLVRSATSAPPTRHHLSARKGVTRSPKRNPSAKRKIPLLPIAGMITLVLVSCLAAWVLMHPSQARAIFQKKAAVAPSASSETSALLVADSAPPSSETPSSSAPSKEKIYTSDDAEELLSRKHSIVAFQGALQGVKLDSTKKMLILEFAGKSNSPTPRGKIKVAEAGPDLSREALEQLKGKNLLIHGTVTIYKSKSKGKSRADILINNRLSIEVLP